jgi:hypothetical protein
VTSFAHAASEKQQIAVAGSSNTGLRRVHVRQPRSIRGTSKLWTRADNIYFIALIYIYPEQWDLTV